MLRAGHDKGKAPLSPKRSWFVCDAGRAVLKRMERAGSVPDPGGEDKRQYAAIGSEALGQARKPWPQGHGDHLGGVETAGGSNSFGEIVRTGSVEIAVPGRGAGKVE